MNYQKIVVVCGMSLLSSSALADLSSVLDGGWRVSAGAVYDSGVKADMRYSPRQVHVAPSVSPGSLSRARARAAAYGTGDGTRTTYVNARKGGAESWTDSQDASAGLGAGHDAGKTTNYRFDSDVWDGNTSFELGYARYEEVSSYQVPFGAQETCDSHDSAMPGVNVQLSRNLYHSEEYRWGVEAAFAVQYARRNNVVRSGSTWAIGKSTRTAGSYSSTYNATGDLAEMLTYGGADAGYVHDYVWNGDANGEYVGAGGLGGFASPISLGDVVRTASGGSSTTSAEYGSLDARGDYDNLELMLLCQPYYDICSWLSVNATLGLVVSRQSMEMSFAMLRNGVSEYRSDRDFSQWDVYGVAGLGTMLYYKGFTLSGDFMARFLDRDMDIDDDHYHGTVSRGNWMFRLALGYEF